jgi:hypothetical protein
MTRVGQGVPKRDHINRIKQTLVTQNQHLQDDDGGQQGQYRDTQKGKQCNTLTFHFCLDKNGQLKGLATGCCASLGWLH